MGPYAEAQRADEEEELLPLELTAVGDEAPVEDGGASLRRVLIVEDDIADLSLIRRSLNKGGGRFEVFETSCAETALGILDKFHPDCILLDNLLPSCSGLEFVTRMTERFGRDFAALIMVTGDESQRTGIDAIKGGINEVVSKANLSCLDLGELVVRVLDARRAHQETGRRIYTEKLASLSSLVAGAAHDINNPAAIARLTLSAVTDTLANLDQEPKTFDREEIHRLEELVRAANDALAKIGMVVRGLERQTGTSLGQIHQLTLDQTVRTAAPSITALLSQGKQVVYRLNSPDSVVGDITQLARVVVDLVANALEAVEPGKVVEVTTRSDGELVELVVDDDGPGIDKDDEKVIFEPLYTTRRSRGALGMGLARAAAVVERHGGRMRVLRSPLGGARFEMCIPLFRGDSSPRSSSLIRRSRRVGQRLRVLVIDDDPGIRASYERVLNLQFDVQTVEGASAALALLESERFDVILCDVIMPGVDGVHFAQSLKQKRPEQAEALLFCTGGVLEAEQEKFLSGWSNGYLRKPLSASELTTCLLSFAKARIE